MNEMPQETQQEYLPAYSDIPAPEEYQEAQPQVQPPATEPTYDGGSPAAPAQSSPALPPAPPAQNSLPPAAAESGTDSSAIKFPSPWQQSKPIAEYSRQAPQTPTLNQPLRSATSTPGLIGPIGYDMEK
jgi:hypothetical protein